MVAAVVLTLITVGGSLLWPTAPASLAKRLATIAAVDMIVVAWLAAAIGNVARLRFFSPDDIAGGGMTMASDRVRSASAILQNTLEQVALAIPVHVALAITIARPTILIVLGCWFAIGRALFWTGYARGAQARAFGFALTFYPSVAGLLVAGFTIIARTLGR